MSYKSANLNLTTQAITGGRLWDYADTGSTVATVVAAGFFTDAGRKGAKVGDALIYRNLTLPDRYDAHFSAVSDTGTTQGTIVLDTD
jgi:hypothetical protein